MFITINQNDTDYLSVVQDCVFLVYSNLHIFAKYGFILKDCHVKVRLVLIGETVPLVTARCLQPLNLKKVEDFCG